ncbi:MAG: 5-methyltetrahydropteroyltriglutamate--homocysteine S-methyltransferase [Caulobacter sp.]
MPVTLSTLGFPRIGERRELKTALEAYWSGKTDAAALRGVAAELRARNWLRQKALGVDHIPSNDFSLYDHVLDTAFMVGAIPERYGEEAGLATYFAMARGSQTGPEEGGCAHAHAAIDVPAMELTKWLDTNYHYLKPELRAGQGFRLTSAKPVDEFLEAKALGVHTRPVILGPVSFLKLAATVGEPFDALTLLPALLPVYQQVLARLEVAGAEWVQIDEPVLTLDLDAADHAALKAAYTALSQAAPKLKILLAAYFAELGGNLDAAVALPVQGLHLDLVRAPEQLEAALAAAPAGLVLSLGVIDGRNIWRADLARILDRLEPVVTRLGADRVIVSSSSSLLHTPIDLTLETGLSPELKTWLAFAVQKVEELSILGRALNKGRGVVREALARASDAADARSRAPSTLDPVVRARLAAVTPEMARRAGALEQRRTLQAGTLGLPAFPTTTIGSFPQTSEVRKARAAHAKATLSAAQYDDFLREATRDAVAWQEEVGIDVLVHGEFERNDMVQYFGEQLSGFAFTKHAWVQSYGSRCVRPPILYGDVSRPSPMTVEWWRYAQSLTAKPMKGMLTGPVTILQWSFVRDDIARSESCRQIALAIRDEVVDLEAAGARIIQIDEAALREGLPLRRAEWPAYLAWAVEAFRLAASGVRDETQIHTHMCYSEFNDIIADVGAMDADVISIETARSHMALLDAFSDYAYPADIGPGVYDIHAPRIPSVEEMVGLLAKAGRRLPIERLWVNPDCGLKTRGWDEVKPALLNMVEAARRARKELNS